MFSKIHTKSFKEMCIVQITFFYARISLAKEDKAKCLGMCNHPELLEGHIVCNGDAPSQCRTRLSCQDSCACIVNVECNESIGGKSADGMVRVLVQFKIFSRFHLRPGLSPTRSLSTSTTMMDQRSRTTLLLLRRGKEILHWLALLRCSQAAPQFDLGCQSPRPYTSNIFCPTKDQCTCYIQYSPCRSVFF